MAGVWNLKQRCIVCSLQFLSRMSFSIRTKRSDEYTHIIVGAGSAGCVLANRLSARPSNKVLLLEAGRKGASFMIQMPAAVGTNLGLKTYNWYYHTVPQRYMDNRKMYWPRGKVLGGSSSINGMVYIRGHPEDYDRWEREGAVGWSYADCLPYFKRSQNHELGGNDYRGNDGPLYVSTSKAKNPLYESFVKAGEECGYPRTSDFNGYQQEGVGYLDTTVHRGIRCSTANAYLRAGGVLKRDNLTVLSGTFANRIVFEGSKAVGIEYSRKRSKMVARATDEVILSGGSINSPQLLMLSGVGDADDLKGFGIPLVAHLPGVGQNLQDHLQVYIQYQCNKPITLYKAQWKFPLTMASIGLEWLLFHSGLGASTHLDAGAFMRSRPDAVHPDIGIHFLASISSNHGRNPGDCHGFQAHAFTLRETSRGTIKLRSRNPTDHPLIDPNYLETEIDRKDMRQAIRLTREIIAQGALDEFRGKEISPGVTAQTDWDIDAFVRAKAESVYHPTSTCKMGSPDDPMAVVDNTTRVFGVENLRVVDASVMPSVVSGNTNAPTIMISEKAADNILRNKPLERIEVPVWKPASPDSQRDGNPILTYPH